MEIAVIGAGISGLTAAHTLCREHKVTLFEKNNRLGGHTATVDFELEGRNYAVDTGFIVFNDWTYPNFIHLLDKLGVESQASSMGFSVSCPHSGLEYAGNNLNTLFAQRKNLFSPRFLHLVSDILKFNKQVSELVDSGNFDGDLTLGQYLDLNGYSKMFAKYYLIPMGSAIWSMSCQKMYDFPLRFFATFFKNHGLLNVKNRPTWRVIKGGSKQYLDPLARDFKDNIHLGSKIKRIIRPKMPNNLYQKVKILFHDGTTKSFDQVVIATHSDQALALLDTPSREEREVLSAIKYDESKILLHYDEAMLPKNRRTWSSWNYKISTHDSTPPTLTYNMNILQGIKSDKTFCVTLNDDTVDPKKLIGEYYHAHPQFTLEGEIAKSRWNEVNGVNRTWFCGAYWRNGFHEDGVVSGLRVAEGINKLEDYAWNEAEYLKRAAI